MLHRGKTRPNIFNTRFKSRVTGFIGRHYTCTPVRSKALACRAPRRIVNFQLQTRMNRFSIKRPPVAVAALLLSLFCASAAAQSAPKTKNLWKSVPFAIVHFNDDAPTSWNLYFSSKRGVLLLRLWKRYLLIDRNSQQAFDIDPGKIVTKGDDVEF